MYRKTAFTTLTKIHQNIMSIKKLLSITLFVSYVIPCMANEDDTNSVFSNIDPQFLARNVGTSQRIKTKFGTIDFRDYYSRPITQLFDVIGEPDYQSGWIGYCEDSGPSLYSQIFNDSYNRLEIPIKAYTWRLDKGYLLCLCTYSDAERALSFPLSYRWDEPKSFAKWFAHHSYEDGFCLLFWKLVDNLKTAESYSFLDYPEWSTLGNRTKCDLYEFYLSNYVIFSPGRGKIHLKDVLGVSRDEYISDMGQPTYSQIYCKLFMPRSLREETYIIRDKIPLFFRVDEYYNKYTTNIHVYYDLRESLIWVNKDRYERVFIQY